MALVQVKRKAKEEEKKKTQEQKLEKIYQVDQCDECKKPNLKINHVEGTIVCSDCGLVQQQRIIDDSSEWRSFSSENSAGGANSNRVGGKWNPYLSNYGIDTVVKGTNANEINKYNERSSLTAVDK